MTVVCLVLLSIIALLGMEAGSKAEENTSRIVYSLVQPGWDLTLEKSDGALQVVSASSPDTLSNDEARIIGQLRFLRSVSFAGTAEDSNSDPQIFENLPSLKEVRLRLRWSPGPGQVKKVHDYLATLPTVSHLEIQRFEADPSECKAIIPTSHKSSLKSLRLRGHVNGTLAPLLHGLELTAISLASRSPDPLLEPSDRDAIAEQSGLSHLEIIGNPFSPPFVDLDFLPSLSPGLRLELRHVKVRGEALADSHAIESLAFTGVMLASGSLNDILENPDLRRLLIDRCSNDMVRFTDRTVVLPDPPVSIALMLPRSIDLAAYSRLSSEFSVTLGRPRMGYMEFLPDHSAFIRDDNMMSRFDANSADALFDFENLKRLELHNTRVDPELLVELLSTHKVVDIYLNNNEYLPLGGAATRDSIGGRLRFAGGWSDIGMTASEEPDSAGLAFFSVDAAALSALETNTLAESIGATERLELRRFETSAQFNSLLAASRQNSVRHLELNDCTITQDDLIELLNVFRGLEEITFFECFFEGCDLELLSGSSKVQKVRFEACQQE